MKYNLIINDKEFDVEVGAVQDGYAQVFVNDELFEVGIESYQVQQPAPRRAQPVMARRVAQPAVARQPQSSPVVRQSQPTAAPRQAVQPAPPKQQLKAAPQPAPAAKPAAPKAAAASGAGSIKAPMPGLMIDIKVKVGDAVKIGQVVAIMEAMKMENDLPSTLNGTVKEVCVQKGAQVSTGDVLIVIG